MTNFERRVELATDALCSPTSSPETRRKMRRYARRVVRALDEPERRPERTEAEFGADMRSIVAFGAQDIFRG